MGDRSRVGARAKWAVRLVAAAVCAALLPAVTPVAPVQAAGPAVPGAFSTLLGGGHGLLGDPRDARLPNATPTAVDPVTGAAIVVVERKVLRVAASSFVTLAVLPQDVDSVLMTPTGTIYVGDGTGVYRVGPGGSLTRLAGNGQQAGSSCVDGSSPGVGTFAVAGERLAYDAATQSVLAASYRCFWRIPPSGSITATVRPDSASSNGIHSIAVDGADVLLADGAFLWRLSAGSWTPQGLVFGDPAPGRPLAQTGIATPVAAVVGTAHRLIWSQGDGDLLTALPTSGNVAKVASRPGCSVLSAPAASGTGVLRCLVDPADPWYSDIYLQTYTLAGQIATVAASAESLPSPDGTAATDAHLGVVEGLATAPNGLLWFTSAGRIRQVDATGKLRTVSSDPRMVSPRRIAFAPDGTAYVADPGAGAVWVVDPATSAVRALSVAGVVWQAPRAVAVAPDGAVLVADGDLVRRVPASGPSTVLVGGGATTPAPATTTISTAALATGGVDDLGVAADGTVAISAATRWFLPGDGRAHRLPVTYGARTSLLSAGGGAWWTGDMLRARQDGGLDVVAAGGLYADHDAQIALQPDGTPLYVVPDFRGSSVMRLDDPGILTADAPPAASVTALPGELRVDAPTPIDNISTTLSATPEATCETAYSLESHFVREPDSAAPLTGGRTYYVVTCRPVGVTIGSFYRGGWAPPTVTPVVALVDRTAPVPVTGLSAFEGRDVVQLNFVAWDRPYEPDLDRFVVRIRAGAGFPATPSEGTAVADLQPTGAPSIPPLTNLAFGTSYGVSVFALDISGNYSAAATLRVSLDRSAPGPVTALVADPGVTSVVLQWELPTDPDLAAVHIDVVAGSQAPTDRASAMRYQTPVTGTTEYFLAQGTVHTAALWTEDRAGNIAATPTTVTFTTDIDLTPPAAPSLTIGKVTDHAAVLTASPALPKPADYAGTVALVKQGTTGPTSRSDGRMPTGLASNTTYTARAFSYDVYGNTSASEPITFTTAVDVTAPRVPTLSMSSFSSRFVTLRFQPNFQDGNPPDAATYLWAVRPGGTVAAEPDAGRSVAVNGSSTVAVSHSVETNGTYTFTLWAVDEAGNRSLPASGTITTTVRDSDLPRAVSALTTTATLGGIDVAWTPGQPGSSPTTGYRVRAVDDRDRTGADVDVAAGSTSVSLTLPGRRWQVCVAALNVDGAGSESCNWWVTPQDETAPPALSGVSLVASAGSASVHWSRSQPLDVDHVVVVRKPGSVPPGSPTDGVATSVALDAPFPTWTSTAATRYAWSVYAVDGAGLLSAPVELAPGLLRITLSAPASVAFASTARVQGSVSVEGPGSIAGRSVVVMSRPRGTTSWTVLGRTTTTANGAWSLAVAPSRPIDVRAEVTGTGVLGSASAIRSVTLTPGVTASAGSRARAGAGVLISGRAYPATSGNQLLVQRKSAGGWKKICLRPSPASGTYKIRCAPGATGRLVLRVVLVDRSRTKLARSPKLRVQVVR